MIPHRYLITIFCLIFFIKLSYSSVSFKMNPGCNLSECKTPGYPAIFYADHFIGDDAIHILYSSFDELTISIIQTKKGYGPHINYTALFNKTYPGSITFGDTVPINLFSLVLRRLIKFDDIYDTGRLNETDNSTESYWLNELKTNITDKDNNTTQPTFYLPLKNIDGLLTIDIIYPGESKRDSKFPKLRSMPKSYFLNIALNADNYTSSKTRFAFEFYIIQLGIEGTQLSTSRFIDDQYTPGIFNVWQIKSRSPIYSSSLLWKPVVYQSVERLIERTTLMEVYNLSNNIQLQPSIDQGIFNALHKTPYVSAFNISLGRKTDGFFAKSNYTFVQMTAGLDILEIDSTIKFISLALIFSLVIPGLVALIGIIFIIKRRCTKPNIDGYDVIDD